MRLAGKNILVTGGAGFIGSHLVDALIGEGAYVRVLDNLVNGKLEMDFMVLDAKNSTHVLNAVSPGFTCSFPFAEYVVNKII